MKRFRYNVVLIALACFMFLNKQLYQDMKVFVLVSWDFFIFAIFTWNMFDKEKLIFVMLTINNN